MLNRKFADLRHAPDLDPRLLRYEVAALPQAVVAIGPAGRPKTKGGVVLAAPGFTWSLFFFPGRWFTITTVHDGLGSLVGHHVDLCAPPEEYEGMLSFVDLKLDLLIRADGGAVWLDQDEYRLEVEAGTIPSAWQREVTETVAAIDRERRAGAFPPPAVEQYRPAVSAS